MAVYRPAALKYHDFPSLIKQLARERGGVGYDTRVRHFQDDRPGKPLKPSHIYRDLHDLIWPRRRLFTFGLVLVFINRAAALVLPGSTKYLIDDVVQRRQENLLFPIVEAVAVGS